MTESKEIDREKLADLLAKVKAATGPDIEIDAALYVLEVPRMAEVLPHWSPTQQADLLTRYTDSIDAALALVERMLPGTMWRVQSDPDYGDSFEATLVPADIRLEADMQQKGATAPLAILAALLTALSSNPSDTE